MLVRSSAGQLGFDLRPVEPFALQYFVSHSGVAEAYAELDAAVHEVASEPHRFRSFYIYGPKGSGRRHLVQGFRLKAQELGLSLDSFYELELPSETGAISDETVREAISAYEQLRAEGGIFALRGRFSPAETSENPHLTSRLLAGSVLRLQYPAEEELRPLLLSLLERRNLRLSERSIAYLVKRIPLAPLSFDSIFDKISQISLGEGKPARLGVLRQALSEESEGRNDDGDGDRETV